MDGIIREVESMSMRVLHVITSLRTGGAERLMLDLLPRLRNMGHEVEMLLFDGTRTAYYGELEEKGIEIYALSCGASAMHNPLLVWKLRTFLSTHKYDIIHTHNTPCQLFTAMTSRGETLVTTEHNTTNHRRRWGWYKGADRWMYGKYSHIVCVSQGVKDNLEAQLGDIDLTNRIDTITNGIDLDKFMTAQPNRELQERYKDKHILIMVAAFRKQKDQQTLLRAMKLLSEDYILLLVGDGERRKECENLARELNVEDKVNFMGFRTDVPSLMATADVLVMSSHWEGCPLSVIEGMAAGLPVVASDVGGLNDTVGEAGMLFPHGNYHRLGQIIRQLCEDKELYTQVAERCKQYAMQFDINRMAREYEQMYKNVI